jgi:hypothetical protein
MPIPFLRKCKISRNFLYFDEILFKGKFLFTRKNLPHIFILAKNHLNLSVFENIFAKIINFFNSIYFRAASRICLCWSHVFALTFRKTNIFRFNFRKNLKFHEIFFWKSSIILMLLTRLPCV